MTLYELIRMYEFETLVPYITDDHLILNACRQAFNSLCSITPSDSAGEQIVVYTHVVMDAEGNEVDRYLYAGGCDDEAWERCLAKNVLVGTAIGEKRALAQIIWQMTFFDCFI